VGESSLALHFIIVCIYVLQKAFPLLRAQYQCSLALSDVESLWLVLRGSLRVIALTSEEYGGYVLVRRTAANAVRMQRFRDEEAVDDADSHCLGTERESELVLSAQQLYTRCLTKTPAFALAMATYSYFRGRGFWVRTGINYGADFTLYRDLPSRCHSEFSVVVVDATGHATGHATAAATATASVSAASASATVAVREEAGGAADRPAWSQIFALTRIMPVRAPAPTRASLCLLCVLCPLYVCMV
jgi:tRNA splicing endonuclease